MFGEQTFAQLKALKKSETKIAAVVPKGENKQEVEKSAVLIGHYKMCKLSVQVLFSSYRDIIH